MDAGSSSVTSTVAGEAGSSATRLTGTAAACASGINSVGTAGTSATATSAGLADAGSATTRSTGAAGAVGAPPDCAMLAMRASIAATCSRSSTWVGASSNSTSSAVVRLSTGGRLSVPNGTGSAIGGGAASAAWLPSSSSRKIQPVLP